MKRKVRGRRRERKGKRGMRKKRNRERGVSNKVGRLEREMHHISHNHYPLKYFFDS